MNTFDLPLSLVPDTVDPDAIERSIKIAQRQQRHIAKRREPRQQARERGESVNYYTTPKAPETPLQEPKKPKLTREQVGVLLADTKGYRVTEDDQIVNRDGRPLKVVQRTSRDGTRQYPSVSIRGLEYGKNGRLYRFTVAKLAAYQRWGTVVFQEKVYIHYHDHNPQHVRPSNLYLNRIVGRPPNPTPQRSGVLALRKQLGGPPQSFTPAQIARFRALMDSGKVTGTDLARLTGKSASLFSLIRRNLIYREEVVE